MKYLKEHFLSNILILACLLAITASLSRFVIAQDYIVEYDGECDPYTQSCFVGCVDDECTEEYYHTWVRKNATDVYDQCGPDVSGCAEASICLATDTDCEVIYCSPDTSLYDEVCEVLDETSMPEEVPETTEEVDSLIDPDLMPTT